MTRTRGECPWLLHMACTRAQRPTQARAPFRAPGATGHMAPESTADSERARAVGHPGRGAAAAPGST